MAAGAIVSPVILARAGGYGTAARLTYRDQALPVYNDFNTPVGIAAAGAVARVRRTARTRRVKHLLQIMRRIETIS